MKKREKYSPSNQLRKVKKNKKKNKIQEHVNKNIIVYIFLSHKTCAIYCRFNQNPR